MKNSNKIDKELTKARKNAKIDEKITGLMRKRMDGETFNVTYNLDYDGKTKYLTKTLINADTGENIEDIIDSRHFSELLSKPNKKWYQKLKFW